MKALATTFTFWLGLCAAALPQAWGQNSVAPPGSQPDAREGIRDWEANVRRDSDRLRGEGKRTDAFRRLLLCPGAECEAAALAVSDQDAQEFLEVLREQNSPSVGPRRDLVEAELNWKLGEKEKSLVLHRKAIAAISPVYGQLWSASMLPRDYYPTVPDLESNTGGGWMRGSDQCFRRPFETRRNGRWEPASVEHPPEAENLWIRRFTEAGAWEDVEKEHARVWAIHRDRAILHRVAEMNNWLMGGKTKNLALQPPGFSKIALSYALYYGKYLLKQKKFSEAEAILVEPILAMDLDRITPKQVQVSDKVLAEAGEHRFTQGGLYFGMDNRHLVGGIGRIEYLNRVMTLLQESGRAQAVKDLIKSRIQPKAPRLLRVLAALEYQTGNTNAAIKLEEEYLAKRKLDPFGLTMRRALYLDAFGKVMEATEAYEAVLKLAPGGSAIRGAYVTPDSVIVVASQLVSMDMPRNIDIGVDAKGIEVLNAVESDLPESDEEPPEAAQIPQFDRMPVWRRRILNRLLEIYQSQRNGEGEARARLESMVYAGGELAEPRKLFEAVQDLQSKGHQSVFEAWARNRELSARPEESRAALHFLLGRPMECLEILTKAWVNNDRGKFPPALAIADWQDQFKKLGRDQERAFLEKMIRVQPEELYWRVGLLSLHEGRDTEALIPLLAKILGPGKPSIFRMRKSVRLPDDLNNPLMLAHRLLRLYRASGRRGEFRALGRRIAEGGSPFELGDTGVSNIDAMWRKHCLSLVEEYKTDEPPIPLRDGWVRGEFPWVHPGSQVRLYASLESPLTVAAGDDRFFTGHPWGVAVFDANGKPEVRIALGQSALSLATSPGFVWAGTPNGLYRITCGSWEVRHLSLSESLAEKPGRESGMMDAFRESEHGIRCLLKDGDKLWMGGGRVVQQLDLNTLEVTAYRKLPRQSERGRIDAGALYANERHVWLARYDAISRYDKASGTWADIPPPEGAAWRRVFNLSGNNLWALAEIREGSRKVLCRIGVDDLQAQMMETQEPFSEDHLRPAGVRGNLALFAGSYRVWSWREGDKRLELQEHDLLDKKSWAALPTRLGPFSASLPGGAMVRVLRGDEDGYEYPGSLREFETKAADPPALIEWSDGKGTSMPLGFGEWQGMTRGGEVWDAVADGEGQIWLCTNGGLTVLDAQGKTLRHWKGEDGLVGERITSGAWAAGRLWFSMEWADGALVFYDPRRGTFGSRTKNDGLASNGVTKVEVKDGSLWVHHGLEQGRSPGGFRSQFTPSIVDPQSRTVSETGVESVVDEELQAELRKHLHADWCPVLGGRLLMQRRIGGDVWYCGTHGAVQVKGGGVLQEMVFPRLPAKVVSGDN